MDTPSSSTKKKALQRLVAPPLPHSADDTNAPVCCFDFSLFSTGVGRDGPGLDSSSCFLPSWKKTQQHQHQHQHHQHHHHHHRIAPHSSLDHVWRPGARSPPTPVMHVHLQRRPFKVSLVYRYHCTHVCALETCITKRGKFTWPPQGKKASQLAQVGSTIADEYRCLSDACATWLWRPGSCLLSHQSAANCWDSSISRGRQGTCLSASQAADK